MKTFKVFAAAFFCSAALLCAEAGPTKKTGEFTKSNDGEWTTKVSVKRGEEYTFWVVPGTVDGMCSLNVEGEYKYKEDGETYEEWIWASGMASKEDGTEYVLLAAEDWELVPSRVSSVSFTVTVSGFWDEEVKANNKFTLYYEKGRSSFPGDDWEDEPENNPLGSETNPRKISFKESISKDKCAPDEDSEGYFIETSAKLAKGRKYLIGVEETGGLEIYADSNPQVNLAEEDGTGTVKPYYGWEDCTEAYSITPGDSTAVKFRFQMPAGEPFKLWYQVMPALSPEKHDSTPIAVGETSEPFNPGYMCDPAGAGWDDVIDQELFAVSGCEKDCSYVFETSGADAALIMRVYDKSGKILAENFRTAGEEGAASDLRCVWTAPSGFSAKSGLIYVGVCQQLESEDDEPYAGEVTLTVRKASPAFPLENLSPVPDATEESPVLCPDAQASAEAVLSDAIWTNTYAIAARAGVTYRVKAESEDASGLSITSVVYTVSGTKATLLTAKANGLSGSIDPAEDGWLEFTPSAHGMVYIDTFVADGSWGTGRGLDYGPYKVFATAAGQGMGVLKVDMKGAPESLMGWQIIKKNGKTPSPKEPFYAPGASAIVEEGEYVLQAQAVKNFAAPDRNGFAEVTVAAGETAAAEYKYTDVADPLDDSPDTKAAEPSTKKKYSPAKLAPSSSKPAVAERSLWSNDEADWFVFTAAEGSYYRFSFAERSGDAKMAVFGPDNWTEECEYAVFEDPEDSLQMRAARKGAYYVCVSHADSAVPQDSSYVLEAAVANPGVVKFAKTSVSVKDSAAYADLSVSRTGKDGKVRVAFRTKGDQTGVKDAYYYPTNGVLEWAEGDMKAKTIRVRLVPQSGWHSGKSVKVVLEKFTADAEDFDRENEYAAAFDIDKRTAEEIDTAEITVSATAKQTPGTIQAVCATPKKPVFGVTAGETLVIPLERISGADGAVGVSVATVKGTANKTGETDFTPVEETLVWEDGETGAKEIAIKTKTVDGDYTAMKTFTLKIAALASKKGDEVQYAKPAIAAATITVNIANEKFAGTLAAAAKSTTAATHGYTVKEGRAGTWLVDADGGYFAPADGDLTFRFSATGVFTYTVDGEAKEFEATARNKTLTVKGVSTFSIDSFTPDGAPVVLRQGVFYEENFGSKGTVKAQNLPAGLKLAQDRTTKEWILSGVPSKPGIYQSAITISEGKTVLSEETYCYTVEAAGSSIGTFTGIARTFDATNRLPGVASIKFTSTAAGKLSAKAQIAGKTYTFAADGFSDCGGTPGDPDDMPYMTAELVSLQKTGSGKTAATVTNTMLVTVFDLPETDEASWSAEGTVEIRMAALPDVQGTGFQEDVWYEGRLCRDNSKVAAWQEKAAAFAGYYTIALVSPDAASGEPRGNGYLTLTLDAKGKAKIAGMFPDGTKYSAASIAANILDDGGETLLLFPVYACKNPFAAGGWIALKVREDGTAVATIDANETITFANDSPAATWDGTDGHLLELYPAGGFYDTVSNLQRQYLESSLSVELADCDDVLDELAQTLPDGYAFAADPSGEAVELAGNALSVAKQSLVKNSAKLNDWEQCVNAANFKPSFKRATGELSGSFDLWYEGVNAKGAAEQKALSGVKFYALFIPVREDNGLLDDDVWATGFYTVPLTFSETVETQSGSRTVSKTVTRKYNASYRIDVKETQVPREWTDGE